MFLSDTTILNIYVVYYWKLISAETHYQADISSLKITVASIMFLSIIMEVYEEV